MPDRGSDRQRWRLAEDLGNINGHMPVRNKWADSQVYGQNMAMSQSLMHVGTTIVLRSETGAQEQWWKSYRCGDRFNDNVVTPVNC